MADKALEALLKETRTFKPSKEFVKAANAGSEKVYR